MFSCFGGGQHPDHPVTVLGQGTEIAEKHLVVAQSIGGHQAVGQPPSGVGDPQHRFEDLCVCRQLPETCPVQPITAGFLSPVLRQGKTEMLGQGREGRGTLLTTAASILITAQGLQQQCSVEGGFTAEVAQASEIGEVGPTPGGAAAGGGAAAAGVVEKGLFEGADRCVCTGSG